MRGWQGGGAHPDPILALRGGDRIQVEQHVPLGGVGPVGVERGAPPHAARVGRVLPEIVDQAATPGRKRQVVRPVQQGAQRVPVGFVARAAEPLQRGRGLGVHPCDGALALHLLQPKPGIIVGRGEGGGVDSHDGDLCPFDISSLAGQAG